MSVGNIHHGGAENAEKFPIYEIGTLRDIFNLPSYEHMERCLDELKRGMLQARAMNDLLVSCLNLDGKKIDLAFEWPEKLQWQDDGRKEIHAHYTHGGKTIFEMHTVKKGKAV